MSKYPASVGVQLSELDRVRMGLDGPHMAAPMDIPEVLIKIHCKPGPFFVAPELTIEAPRHRDWEKRTKPKRRRK